MAEAVPWQPLFSLSSLIMGISSQVLATALTNGLTASFAQRMQTAASRTGILWPLVERD
jgi:hypothetical protein